MNQSEIIESFLKSYGTGANYTSGFLGMTLGVVVDGDDPLQMGRLKVFCPTLGDDPKVLGHIPWSIYISPFAGTINNNTYTRGAGADANATIPSTAITAGLSDTKDGAENAAVTPSTTPTTTPTPSTSTGSISYGFYAIPEMGSHVLVGCIDGDHRRRFWIGCAQSHQENNTLLTGRWKWKDDGTVDGPLSSSGDPIQPAYDNLSNSFGGNKKSPEWKSRIAEYQPIAIRSDYKQLPNSKITESDQINADIIATETDEWIKDALGAHGYDWTGFKSLGAYLSSRVFGFSTPGNNSLLMDDRPFNNRIRLRTTTGHQILLDDTNERIYISTNKGNSWVEMDSNGNIDMYSATRVSIACGSDMNFTSEGTIRMYASESIHMYAGHDYDTSVIAPGTTSTPTPTPGLPAMGDSLSAPLDALTTPSGDDYGSTSIGDPSQPPVKGEIRIHASTDFHTVSNNSRHKTLENSYQETGMNHYHSVGDSHVITAQNDMNASTIIGDHIVTSGNNIHSTSTNDTKHYAKGKTSIGSYQNAEVLSLNGETSVSGMNTVKIKSASSHVDLQASAVSGTGSVKLSASNSQTTIGPDGITHSSTGAIISSSGTEVTHQSAPGYSGDISTTPQPSNMDSLMFGIGLTWNIHSVTTADIKINAALGDIIQKTAILGHSYNALSTKVSDLVTGLDLTTYQLNLVSVATSTAISALSGSFSIPFSFNLGCLEASLFGSLPSALTSVFATLGALNAALVALGHAATTIEGLAGLLNGNISLLGLLGLPTSISLADFGISTCIPALPMFGGSIASSPPGVQTIEQLRSLVHGIYQAGAPRGTPPPLTPFDFTFTCPITFHRP